MTSVNRNGYRILALVLALLFGMFSVHALDVTNTTTPYIDQSIIDNLNTTQSNLNLLMKVQYYNSTSTSWQDSITVYDKNILIGTDTIALDGYWNNTWWNASSLVQGYGLYRAYSALLLPNGTIAMNANLSLLEASYEFNYLEDVLNITGAVITPDDDEFTPGSQINPLEASNVTVTVVANITNSTPIDSCSVRVWNSSGSYLVPTLGIFTGVVSSQGLQTQCNASFSMEYWRNAGDWNVSVQTNTTRGTVDNKNISFYYNVLRAHGLTLSNIAFNALPGQTVNSTNAYPVNVTNYGNSILNISISSTDFVGVTDSNFTIGAGNVTSSIDSVVFNPLSNNYIEVYLLGVNEQKPLYFRAFTPLGLLSQVYQSTISVRST